MAGHSSFVIRNSSFQPRRGWFPSLNFALHRPAVQARPPTTTGHPQGSLVEGVAPSTPRGRTSRNNAGSWLALDAYSHLETHQFRYAQPAPTERRPPGNNAASARPPTMGTRRVHAGQNPRPQRGHLQQRVPAGFTRGGRRSVDAAGTHTAKQRRAVGWFVRDAGSDLATHWFRYAQPAPTERRPPGNNAASARPPPMGARRVHAGQNPRPQRGHLQQQGTRRVHAGQARPQGAALHSHFTAARCAGGGRRRGRRLRRVCPALRRNRARRARRRGRFGRGPTCR
jgi:hypothetical protein